MCFSNATKRACSRDLLDITATPSHELNLYILPLEKQLVEVNYEVYRYIGISVYIICQ